MARLLTMDYRTSSQYQTRVFGFALARDGAGKLLRPGVRRISNRPLQHQQLPRRPRHRHIQQARFFFRRFGIAGHAYAGHGHHGELQPLAAVIRDQLDRILAAAERQIFVRGDRGR